MKRDSRIHFLSWDHHTALMESFKITKFIDSKSTEGLFQLRAQIINFWKEHLLQHFRAEEECLLPRLALYQDTDEFISKTLTEHIQIHKIILLIKESTGEKDLKIYLKHFAKLLNDHIRFEERDLFEAIQSLLTDEQLNQIYSEITERYGDKYRNQNCQLPQV